MNNEVRNKLDKILKNYHWCVDKNGVESVTFSLMADIKLTGDIDKQIKSSLQDMIQLIDSCIYELERLK